MMESPIKRRVSNAQLRSPLPDLAQGAVAIERLERSAEELSAGGSDIGEEIKRLRERSASRSRSSRQNSLHHQNSIQSSHQGEFLPPSAPWRINSASGRSTTTSRANSYASSVVDARWGGQHHNNNYTAATTANSIINNNNNNITSPGSIGGIISPIGSVRSGSSWTQPSIHRAASGSKTSRLGQMVEPLHEGRPLDSPSAPSSASLYSQDPAISSSLLSRQASHSSFVRRYDHIAAQIEESLATIPPTPPIEEDLIMDHDPRERRPSTDTFQEAQAAFQDFDGVHYSPDTEEYIEVDHDGQEIRRVSARTSSGTLGDMASMMQPQPQSRPMSSERSFSPGRPLSMALGAPPPGEDMVYYPAPVPRMLNLPKRLSKLPPAHVQAQRRSEMLQAMPRENRESAPWIPPIHFGEEDKEKAASGRGRSGSVASTDEEQLPRGMLNQRMSMANPPSLPPQLRASMYFQQQPVEHEVRVQGGSAVATLDAILQSSANAPVTAFTDHPYAGDVRKSVYAPEQPMHNRKSTSTTLDQRKEEAPKATLKKKRSSSIGNFFRRNSTTLDGETGAQEQTRPGSMLDMNGSGNKLRKRRSQMSLGQMSTGDDLTADRGVRTSGDQINDMTRRQSGLVVQAVNSDPSAVDQLDQRKSSATEQPERVLAEGEQVDQDFRDEQEREDWDHDDPVFAQPSTLLAELQVRKAQLKSRNKTAATAFPNGMHSTLLQLDAVEAIEAKKRQKKKIALAWEDHQGIPDDNSDDGRDDVPLGVLYPSKQGNGHRKMGDERDWNRPLGLMDRRELEENEPLGHRRARLNPSARPLNRGHTMSQLHLAGQPDMPVEDDEHEGETLRQRGMRMKLGGAISDVHKDGQPPDSSFTDELLGQFGGLQVTNPDATASDRSTLKEAASLKRGEEEETLGQRAARLRREREASGESHPSQGPRPPSMLRSVSSMANLLAENPVSPLPHKARDIEAAEGTLLHTNQQHQARHKHDLLANNMRASSYNLTQPLVDSRPRNTAEPGGLIGNESSRPANGLFAGARSTSGVNTTASHAPPNRSTSYGGLLEQQQSRPANGLFNPASWHNGSAAATPQPSQLTTPIFAGQGYFASPTAGMNYGAYGAQPNMMGNPYMQQYQPQMVNPSAYYALHGGGHVSMMPTGYSYAPQHQMLHPGQPATAAPTYADPAQASSIERWRQNIAPA